jgi:inosine-uridine nucleoside N-ribohydrolase
MKSTYLLFFCCLLTTCSSTERSTSGAPAPEEEGYQSSGQFADRPKLILDSDTANEIDDLFAIARILPDSSVDLLGLSSAQWFSSWSGDSTVYESQRLNEELLQLSGRMDLPHPLGADSTMGKPWGDYDPRSSPATDFIINQVKALPKGEKLVVMSIGAATNLASAIAIDSTIAPRIVAYLLGFRYNFSEDYWNKDEFNIRRDLNAANFLLNQQDLELHVMPINVAIEYTWDREDTFNRLSGTGALGEYLKNRWQSFGPDATRWIMWDVALLQAFLHPELAEETTVMTPPENTRRKVFMYTDIDFEGMYQDFWSGF